MSVVCGKAVELASALMTRPSVTPDDGGCLAVIASRMQTSGFSPTWIQPGLAQNLFLQRGTTGNGVLLVAHVDVVPPGSGWTVNPWSATIERGKLIGRGASDMKGPLAAGLIAVERVVEAYPHLGTKIGVLITSDEEVAKHGGTGDAVPVLLDELRSYDFGLVLEPSSDQSLADRVKVGARGAIVLTVTISGVSSHVGYSRAATEPIAIAAEVIERIYGIHFAEEDQLFSHQDGTVPHATNIRSGSGAVNAVDSECVVQFDVRTSPAYTLERLKVVVEETLSDVLQDVRCRIDLHWREVAKPWYSQPGKLACVVDEAVHHVLGQAPPVRSVSGGSGDGRFLQGIVREVLELGPCTDLNLIHGPDEFILLADLNRLVRLYQRILCNLLGVPDLKGCR